MDADEVRDHDCPPTTESQETTEIDGEPALLSVTHCPADDPDGGLQILRAIVVKDGTAYYFWMQDPANVVELEPDVRGEFAALLAGISLPAEN